MVYFYRVLVEVADHETQTITSTVETAQIRTNERYIEITDFIKDNLYKEYYEDIVPRSCVSFTFLAFNPL